MSGLKYTMAAIPGGNTRRTYGTAYHDGSRWWANVGGNLLPVRWNPALRVAQGQSIVIDITNDGQGQSTAWVAGAYTEQPVPPTGAVMAVGVSDILFGADDGGTYTTDRYLGPISNYSVSDPVYLQWDADKPTVMGVIADVIAVPAVPPPPPPTVAASGEVSLPATASDTFGVGGWGRWASSTNGGEDVYTGSWGGYTVTGSWFYGAPRPELQGKTITRIQFRIPARLAVGAYGDATIHFYAHDSSARPGGDVNRVAGPHDVTIPHGFGGGLTDLPLSFAPALVAGGGVSIAGNPYAGFQSRLDNPSFGQLLISWSS